MEKTIEESLEELSKALEANKNVGHNPAITVTAETDKYLSQKAKEALSKIQKTLIISKDKKVIGRAVYFSAVVADNNLDEGIQKMSEIANRLADKGWIISALASISSLKLALLPGELKKQAVFFFPHIAMEHVEEVEKMEHSIKEGEVGKPIGNTSLILPKGEFWAEARIIHDITKMTYSAGHDIDGRLFDIVQEYLRVLPEGTKFLGANRCAIYDLSTPYELRFSNPLLDRVRNVELEYRRTAAVVDDKLVQGNIVIGVKYFDSEGKRLYK